jgi:hypothetical protein
LPNDPQMAGEIRTVFRIMDADTYLEVDQVAAHVARFGADRDEYAAIFNEQYEVILCKVCTGHVLVFVRDRFSARYMFVRIVNGMPTVRDAAYWCARAVGVAFEGLRVYGI